MKKGARGPNCIIFGEDTAGPSSAFGEFVLNFTCIAPFLNAGGSQRMMSRIEAISQFALFDPSVKIRGRIGELCG